MQIDNLKSVQLENSVTNTKWAESNKLDMSVLSIDYDNREILKGYENYIFTIKPTLRDIKIEINEVDEKGEPHVLETGVKILDDIVQRIKEKYKVDEVVIIYNHETYTHVMIPKMTTKEIEINVLYRSLKYNLAQLKEHITDSSMNISKWTSMYGSKFMGRIDQLYIPLFVIGDNKTLDVHKKKILSVITEKVKTENVGYKDEVLIDTVRLLRQINAPVIINEKYYSRYTTDEVQWCMLPVISFMYLGYHSVQELLSDIIKGGI